jgi:hypothetical protein
MEGRVISALNPIAAANIATNKKQALFIFKYFVRRYDFCLFKQNFSIKKGEKGRKLEGSII